MLALTRRDGASLQEINQHDGAPSDSDELSPAEDGSGTDEPSAHSGRSRTPAPGWVGFAPLPPLGPQTAANADAPSTDAVPSPRHGPGAVASGYKPGSLGRIAASELAKGEACGSSQGR